MLTIFVMPCLNEESYLLEACQSLGFGNNSNVIAQDQLLIIVDNGSTDSSIEIAESIKNNSPLGTVFLFEESTRGYIQARHRGNLEARKIALKMKIPISKIFILQVDSDTIYQKDYGKLMARHATNIGKNNIFQARSIYEASFSSTFSEYITLCDKTDSKFSFLYGDSKRDYIIDDKVAGYWLSDYFKWGSHQSFYDKNGEEIYAETTQLFIKSTSFGAKRVFLPDILAAHSGRNIKDHCLNHFTTAGFPRTRSWYIQRSTCRQNDNYCLEGKVDAEETRLRVLHLLALFYILPLHIDLTNEHTPPFTDLSLLKFVTSVLPKRKKSDLRSFPGMFLMDALSIIDDYSDHLSDLIESALLTKNE